MKIRKILFITLSNIGDVILTMPVLNSLWRAFPGAIIDVMSGPRPYEIFQKDPRVKNVYRYDKHAGLREKCAFIKKLRDEKYDLAVDMRTSLIPLLIGARKRSSLIKRHEIKGRHKGDIHLNKLKELGITREIGPGICVNSDDRGEIKTLLEKHGCDEKSILIGISPSARGILKQWKTDGFIDVIKGILNRGDYGIVLIGDDSQVDTSRAIVDAVKNSAVIDLTGKTSLGGLFALIERMRLLLTCDSAALHIASDLGVKTIALFGPTDPAEYGPRGKDDVVVMKKLKCAPCKKAACAFDRECMNKIRPAEVIEVLNRLLKG